MNSTKRDQRIDDYIAVLPSWQQDICQQIRNLTHKADPDIIETVKRTNRPYFVLNGNVCAILAAKDHVNVFIYDPTVPDPEHIINQGQENVTAKAIQIYLGNILDERAYITLIKAVTSNNRAGGWRKLQKTNIH